MNIRADQTYAAESPKILAALKTGPHTAAALGRLMNTHHSRAGYILALLIRPGGPLVHIGSLESVCAAGVKVVDVARDPSKTIKKVRVFALAGHPIYAPAADEAPRRSSRRACSGSGVIAGPKLIRGYRWG